MGVRWGLGVKMLSPAGLARVIRVRVKAIRKVTTWECRAKLGLVDGVKVAARAA